MSLRNRATFAAFLGLASVHQLFAGGNSRDARHRVPLATPVSSPFTVTEAARLPEWGQVQRLTELIQTDRGALELLKGMPLLEAKYGNPSHFVELVQKWRDRVPVLRGSTASLDEDGSSWVVLQNGSSRTISISFRDTVPENSLTILRITFVGQEVTNLSFAGGFDQVLPHRHRRRIDHS